MPTILINLQYDNTGLEVLNRIEDENHLAIDPVAKMIMPKHGRFFTESLVVNEVGGNVLVKGTHYVVSDYDQQESLKIGKEICKSIIIIDLALGDDFQITYQALGGDFSHSNENLVSAIQDKILPYLPVDWVDITEKPREFPAADHLHDSSEVYGFEYIIAVMNRIKEAMLSGPMPSFESLLKYCDDLLLRLKTETETYLDTKVALELEDFTAQINKSYFKIDALSNLSTIRETQGYNSAKRSFFIPGNGQDQYLSLEGLVGIKKAFYEVFISKQNTGLGLYRGVYKPPIKQTLIKLPNGAVTTVLSRDTATRSSVVFDENIYTPNSADFSDITYRKLSNNLSNAGGVFLAYDPNSLSEYIGALESGNNTDVLVWRKLPSVLDADQKPKEIQDHLDKAFDPHLTNSSMIGLGELEDLPVITLEEVRALKSTRKYVTFDNLLEFVNFFMTTNNTDLRPAPKPEINYLIDNCVVVYSPPGIGCPKPVVKNDCVDPPVLFTTTPPPSSTTGGGGSVTPTPTPTPTPTFTSTNGVTPTPTPSPTGTTTGGVAPTSTPTQGPTLTITSSPGFTPPTVTTNNNLGPVTLLNVSPIPVHQLRTVSVSIPNVNIGSAYDVVILNNYGNGVTFNPEFTFKNVIATADPMIVNFDVSNIFYPLETSGSYNFGLTKTYQARVTEVNRRMNARVSEDYLIVFDNVVNNGVYEIQYGTSDFIFNITWEPYLIKFTETTGKATNPIENAVRIEFVLQSGKKILLTEFYSLDNDPASFRIRQVPLYANTLLLTPLEFEKIVDINFISRY